MPGFQCFWKLKEGRSYDCDGHKNPILLHWMEKDDGYQFVYGIPDWEYPGMMKV